MIEQFAIRVNKVLKVEEELEDKFVRIMIKDKEYKLKEEILVEDRN